MLHPRHWDALLLECVGRLPATPVDRWLRRLSTTADHGKLWALLGVVLALQPGQPRRAAVRGLGSMAASSALVNAVVKRVFSRVRPDLPARRASGRCAGLRIRRPFRADTRRPRRPSRRVSRWRVRRAGR